MAYELKSCPVCGAEALHRIDVEEHGGQLFGVFQCRACDATVSAYKHFLKDARKAAPLRLPIAPEEPREPSVERPCYTVVNAAAQVYRRAVSSTIELVAQLEDGVAHGTGTMVSDKGYFITNAHVVATLEQTKRAVVNFCETVYGQAASKFRFTAELIYLDPACDLALLQTEPDGSMKPVTFCEDEAFPGESVYAIGNSKGEGLCIVEGIVSDVNRRVGGYDAIMISAPVTTGNSGGPVFDAEGRLLGIVQSGRTDVSAMNYVIPTKTILAFLGAAKESKNLSF
jgi:S1-C subfamily serine protease